MSAHTLSNAPSEEGSAEFGDVVRMIEEREYAREDPFIVQPLHIQEVAEQIVAFLTAVRMVHEHSDLNVDSLRDALVQMAIRRREIPDFRFRITDTHGDMHDLAEGVDAAIESLGGELAAWITEDEESMSSWQLPQPEGPVHSTEEAVEAVRGYVESALLSHEGVVEAQCLGSSQIWQILVSVDDVHSGIVEIRNDGEVVPKTRRELMKILGMAA